jgi:CheY-like chemotaxis protein
MERPPRVLLVEDDRFLRRAAHATLKQKGYDVVLAADGEEALALARSSAPDLILLDLMLPRMNGFAVLSALKQEDATRSIPVIVLSNLGQESDLQGAMQAGAVAYYVKANLSLADLVARVETVLAERT